MPATTSDSASVGTVFSSPDPASGEFGMLLTEIIKELRKNELRNLENLQIILCSLTVKDHPEIPVFSSQQIERIRECTSIITLLTVKLNHCYRWDDYSMLTLLLHSLKAKKCLKLLETFEQKIDATMKLKKIAEYYCEAAQHPPKGYYKMAAIVKKDFSSITKKEYERLKQFTSQHCGVEPHVVTPFSTVLSVNSIKIEWFIPESVVSFMVLTAKSNVHEFRQETFVYLKVSSVMIFDDRNNVSQYKSSVSTVKPF